MKNSSLLALLRTFDPSERRAFRLWLQSPVHFQRTDGQRLYELMERQNFGELDRTVLFAQLFDEPYDDARFRQTLHFLRRAAEDFLLHRHHAERDRRELDLSRLLAARGLPKLSTQLLRRAHKRWAEQPLRHYPALLHRYELEFETYNREIRQQRAPAEQLARVAGSFEDAFLANRLRLACTQISHRRAFAGDADEGMLPFLLPYLEARAELPPVVRVYYLLYRSFAAPEADWFARFQAELAAQQTVFDERERRDLYLLGINFCIAKIHAGDATFRATMLGMYRAALDENLLIENGQFSRFAFKNIVTLALAAGEFDWTEQFIHTYRDYLPAAHRDNLANLNLARLYYDRQDYDRARAVLPPADHADVMTNLNARTLLLKIYYEENALRALESHLESTRTYLRRHRPDVEKTTMYKNLFSCTKQLLQLTPYRRRAVEKLRDRVEQLPQLAERAWLRERVGEFL